MDRRIYDAFDSVHAEEELKDKTKSYLSHKLYTQHKTHTSYVRYAVIVLCCLIIGLGVGGYTLYTTPVAAISIDINPSIEFEVNRFDRVISVTGYNDEAKTIVKDLNLQNSKYDDAIIALLESKQISRYLTEDSFISISVASENDSKSTEIQQRVSSCTGKRYGNVSCHIGKSEDVPTAHHSGLSFGKYRAFLELQALDPTVTIEDVKDLTMCQIQDWIDECSGNVSKDDNENQYSNRNGHNNGQENSQNHGVQQESNQNHTNKQDSNQNQEHKQDNNQKQNGNQENTQNHNGSQGNGNHKGKAGTGNRKRD